MPQGSGSSPNTWSLTGNSGINPQLNFLGTTDSTSLRFRTSNTVGMILDSLGNVGIGNAPSFTANPNREKLIVDAGTLANPTTSFNVISGKGYIDNYLQLNIQNRAATAAASSDIVASNDAATETVNFVDMGINSSGNASTGVLGGVNPGYLYSTGADFAIGNATSARSLNFFTGGTAAANERMRIDGTGNVGIATTTPNSTFDVNGSQGGAITVINSSNTITLDATHSTLILSSGTPNVAFPAAASSNARRIYTIVNQTSTVRNISSYRDFTNASNTSVPANSSITIQSNGSLWYRIQ